MVIISEVKYPKKRYKLKMPVTEIYEKLIKEKNNRDTSISKKTREYDFIIYTDGGIKPACNIGSWSYLIKAKINKTHFKFYKGGGTLAVNSFSPILMELKAVIDAVHYVTNVKNIKMHNYSIRSITVYSDNRQVINSRKQYEKYINNDWRLLRSNNKMFQILKEQWEKINDLNERYNINYKWVEAHSGNISNEYCDKACTARIYSKIREKSIIEYNNQKL
jgi:ribonuclease HI